MDGVTPLYDAAQNGHLEVMKYLAAAVAAVNAATKDSHTPM